jgi:CHAD domain-containing protein
MAYSFKLKDKSVKAGLRRIARSQIDAGLEELDDPDLDVSEKVHQVRKRCKKLRALIRLVRPAFPDYATENAAFRDAARTLSDLRDADAMLETLNRVEERYGGEVDAGIFKALRGSFEEAVAERRHAEDLPDRLEGMRQALLAGRARAGDWTLEEDGFEAVAGGLKKTYERARTAHRAARAKPQDAKLHEWRKRIKYHWYHTRLLNPIAPDLIDAHRRACAGLADRLGDRQDFAVLRPRLEDLEGVLDAESLDVFRGLVLKRQDALERASFAEGQRLLADRPKALKRRWRVWWDVWHGKAG